MTQRAIGLWLDDIKSACDKDLDLALEIAECARLVKGYGETFRRGSENFDRIKDAIIAPALDGLIAPARAVDALSNARAAALADPDGERLSHLLTEISRQPSEKAAQSEPRQPAEV